MKMYKKLLMLNQ